MAANVFESLLWKRKSFWGDTDPLVLPLQSQLQQLTVPLAPLKIPVALCPAPVEQLTLRNSGHEGFYCDSTKE